MMKTSNVLVNALKQQILIPSTSSDTIPVLGSAIRIAHWLRCKFYYRKSNIDYAASVDLISAIAQHTKIGAGTVVRNSKIGAHVIISDDCSVIDSALEMCNRLYRECSLWQVNLGAYSYIAPQSVLSMTKIGRFCSIGARLQCTVGDHPVKFVSTHPAFFSTMKQCGVTFAERNYFTERRGLCIGNDVWIGNCVFIRDGVTVGDGAIIAGGAAVVNDVPPYSIVGGVPAKVIKYRFDEKIIEQLKTVRWWEWDEARLRAAQPYFIFPTPEPFLEWARNNCAD